MHIVTIKPQWTIRRPDGEGVSPRLLELLAQVHQEGTLSGVCRKNGASYRHAWSLVRQGEEQLGAPLLVMERGKGSTLTPLAEKLVWASHRIHARLTPVLDTLASELEVEIERVVGTAPAQLSIHASHGFSIEKLLEYLAAAHVTVERKYVASQEAAASLHDGACDLAGLPIALGAFEARSLAHYARWFDAKTTRFIHVATRHQGLMVAPGNPRKIYGVGDLARPDVRFINRQRGSGTRFLLDCLLADANVDPAAIAGFEQGEFTHAAVAAYVASGMADAGLGVETPARHFKLDFVPLASERYFLLCHEQTLLKPGVQATIEILRSSAFRDSVNQLSGYSAVRCGEVETLKQAFADYQPAKKRAASSR
jgi:molybdate transport repressor ModE-like protein